MICEVIAGLALGLVLAVIGGLAFVWWMLQPPRRPRP
jgi:nitrate reductase NapE component